MNTSMKKRPSPHPEYSSYGAWPDSGATGALDPPGAEAWLAERVVSRPVPGVGDGSDWDRRTLSVVVALVGLVVAAPVMLVIALLVKLTSPGPVFYRQERVGWDRRNGVAPKLPGDRRRDDPGGRLFTIWKFRTMYEGSDGVGQVWARKDDDRVTPLGRVLRRYRLDELPQLINVLAGDMNVVGPRPEQPDIFGDLRREIPGFQVRQKVRPGITGLAQVNHHYGETVADMRTKLRYDLTYLGRRSPLEDLRIMTLTLPAVMGKALGW